MQSEGKPFGVPHHTDTSVILYNQDVLNAAGITSVPTTLDKAWTWEEFAQVARQLRRALPEDKYPFAYNWQGNGVTRWLSWLFEADGRFLAEDLVTPAIDSAAGRDGGRLHPGASSPRARAAQNSMKSTDVRQRPLVRRDGRHDLRSARS